MSDQTVILSFPDASPDKASTYANKLKNELLHIAPELSVEVKDVDQQAMDFGATLAIVIGSAAVTALAKGIASFIAKYGDATVEVETKQGRFKAKIQSRDVAEVLRIITKLLSKE